MDRKLWGDPENFRPERFISEDGKLLRPEALIPFGSGEKLKKLHKLQKTTLRL